MTHLPDGTSKATVGSPPLAVSHSGVPLLAKNVSKVNADNRAPVAFAKMPIEVLTLCTKWFGPTTPLGSGGCPAPQLAKSSPFTLSVAPGAAAAVTADACTCAA